MNLKNLTICLTLSVLLGSTGTSWGGDYEKGLAASHGNEKGGKLRDFAAKIMTATQIEKAQELAQECVAKKYKGC